MEIFNAYNTFIKRQYFKNGKRLAVTFFFLLSILLTMAIMIDSREEFSQIYNIARTALISLSGLILYSIYLLTTEARNRRERQKDKDYLSIKEKMSYQQRKNLSIIIAGLSVFLHIGLLPTQSPYYSLLSSFLLSLLLFLFAFIQKTGYEKELERKGFKDIRDIEHEYKEIDKYLNDEENVKL